MTEQVRIPEPPDGSYVLIGRPPLQVFANRDDGSARAAREVDPGRYGDEDACWFPPDSEIDGPYSWAQLTRPEDPDFPDDDLPAGLDRSAVERVYTEAQLDAAVREARAGVVPVGEHLKEPGGYCRTCGHEHAEPEWARIHDGLQRELEQ